MGAVRSHGCAHARPAGGGPTGIAGVHRRPQITRQGPAQTSRNRRQTAEAAGHDRAPPWPRERPGLIVQQLAHGWPRLLVAPDLEICPIALIPSSRITRPYALYS